MSLIEILDEGYTLRDLIHEIREYDPLSVGVIVLLDKPEKREVGINADYMGIGFTIPNKFVVGYGLDYDERWRSLPHIAVLRPERYRG